MPITVYYDVTVKFSPILKETFGQITATQQIYQIRFSQLILGAVAEREILKGGGSIVPTFF